MPFILQVHPVTELYKHLKDRHNHQYNNGKGRIDSSRGSSRERNERQDNRENKNNDVFLWTFRPVTMLHRLLITLILYRHVLPHLSEQVHDRKDKHPDHVNKVPVHCGDVYFRCSYDR